MFAENLRTIIGQAVFDPVFRELLFNHPEQATANYSLSSEERLALRGLTPEDLYACVGRLAVDKLMPLRLGGRLVIAPDWLDPPLSSGDLLIRLDQSKTGAGINLDCQPITGKGDVASLDVPIAFGSGLHPSTRLCLCALEDLLSGGEIVLDLGTGSGILAIAAAKLGAGQVLALDTNAAAIHIARQHVALNRVERIVRVEQGSLESLKSVFQGQARFTAQLVVANLNASIFRTLLQQGLARVLSPGGRMILSGLFFGDQTDMKEAIQTAGLRLNDQRQLEGCLAIICQDTSSGV